MPQEIDSLGALLRIARWLDDERSLEAIAEQALGHARSLGTGHARVVLRARSRRGITTTIVLGDDLESSPTILRIDVPIHGKRVDGVLSLTRPQRDEPLDASHMALLGMLVGSSAERAWIAHDLEESDVERRELIAKVAHDVRTPLQSFSLGLDAVNVTAETGAHDPNMPTTLARMRRSVSSLGHVVDDVEDASRVYDSALKIHPVPHAPDRLIAKACETRANAALARGSTIVAQMSDLAPIACDGSRIVRVLSMLVDNALRYSPRGTTVKVRAIGQAETLRFEVQDDGPGVPEAVRAQIFSHPFRRKAEGKVGLGLFLASAIARAHGGTIDISAEAAHGVTFGIEIPVAPRSVASTH